jgi:hypothetical protein
MINIILIFNEYNIIFVFLVLHGNNLMDNIMRLFYLINLLIILLFFLYVYKPKIMFFNV